MTTEAWTLTPEYTVAGIGPYTITHPYAAGAIRAFVVIAGVRTQLTIADFSLTPTESDTEGDLFLTPAAAATHAGRKLVIDRVTVDEQGWLGVQGEREKGLEVQLDRTIQGLQEVRANAAGAIRIRGELAAFDWTDGTVPIRSGNGVISGPTATDIAGAQEAAAEAVFWAGLAGQTYATRAALVAANAMIPGLGLADGKVITAGGMQYRRLTGATAISSLPGWVPNGDVTPQHFGAVGDGVTNDQPAVDAAFTYMGTTGQKGVVPSGTYFLTNTVNFDCSAGFEVECAADAVFLASAAFPADNRIINPTAATGPARFVWRGGKIDGSLRVPRVAGAPDLLYIAAANLQYVHVENVDLFANATRAGTAGDSCLFLSTGQDYFVSGCKFTGAVDAGIYLSADATGASGRRAIITTTPSPSAAWPSSRSGASKTTSSRATSSATATMGSPLAAKQTRPCFQVSSRSSRTTFFAAL